MSMNMIPIPPIGFIVNLLCFRQVFNLLLNFIGIYKVPESRVSHYIITNIPVSNSYNRPNLLDI